MTSLTHVLTPIRIGTVEVKNRVVRTAHGSHLATAPLTEAFFNYHEARAKGGCGLTILEIASVHPSSVATVRSLDDGIIDGYRELMGHIRPHGMRVFQQLHHGGAHVQGLDGVPWSSGAMPSPMIGMTPYTMRREDIAEVIAAFAAAARRCREGGLDGVEVHAAHGYIFQQFLAAGLNPRDDEYGGSLDNRLRLLRETMKAVRAEVGADFTIGVRMSASEAPAGVTHAEATSALQMLEADGLLDFADISMGDYFRMASMNATFESPAGYELPMATPLTGVVSVPTIVAGRFRTLEEADTVIRAGQADMVSMVRAQIADPDLVAKTMAGDVDGVRPCIACNQGCIGGLFKGGQLGCLVNPAVGFEGALAEERIVAADRPLRVLVVGGGPGGMEAARSARIAGHAVTLVEAQPHLGGTARVAAQAPHFVTLGDYLGWAERELYRLGVEVRIGTYLDPSDLAWETFDVLIVATGAMPRVDGVQAHRPWLTPAGVDLPHVMTSTELAMKEKAVRGRHALVLDDSGQHEALAVVDMLQAQGLGVTYVTRFPMMTPQAEFSQRTVPALERFGRGHFEALVRHDLLSIGEASCIVRPTYGGAERTIPADTVVLVQPGLPLTDLYHTARDAGRPVVLVGDAHAPRDIQAAIGEGRRVAMGLAAFVPSEEMA